MNESKTQFMAIFQGILQKIETYIYKQITDKSIQIP